MSPVGINGVDKQSVGINGVQVKQALSAANSTVNKGVYNATLLETVDADLASANIKSGSAIFGVNGAATVQEIGAADAAVADVLAPKTFFSVTGAIKTGTGAAGTATQDIQGSGNTALVDSTSVAHNTPYLGSSILAASPDLDIATLTQNYAAGSLTEGFCYGHFCSNDETAIKIRLYMNGIQVAESELIVSNAQVDFPPISLNGSAALSGIKIVKMTAHNYSASTRILYTLGRGLPADAKSCVAVVFAGSVKVV